MVLLATTQYAVKIPQHRNLQRGITKQIAVCEDFAWLSTSDESWSELDMSDGTSSSDRSSITHDNIQSPIVVNRHVTRRSTEKKSPLLSGVTLVEHDATLNEVVDDVRSSSEESVSSDSSDDSFDGGWDRHTGLHALPSREDLESVLVKVVPYADSFTYVPRLNNLKRKVLPPEHDDLLEGCIELTEEQGTPDWFIARSFVSTSTTQLEINRAVSLVGVENDSIRVKFEAIKQVIGMRFSAPTPEEAPEIVRSFLVALCDGISMDTTANEWWKGKINGKAITGTQHIDPALCHLGVKVLRLRNNVLFS